MGGWAGARLVSRAGWAAGGRGGGAPGRVIGERCGVDATAGGVRSVAVGTVAQDPWYFKAYDGFSRHVATFRDTDASPKEIYTHHEMGSGGSQLAVRRDVDATGGGGWGGSSDGVLETQAFLLHRANGDVIAVVGGLKDTGSVTRPGAVRERMEYVPGGDGAGSVEPMRLSPSDGYQIGGARGADGLVTGDDYNAWIAEYAAGTANGATDLNNNGVVDGDDFTAWNAEWDSGALVGRAIMSVPDGADAKGPGNVRGAMAAAGVALDAVLSGKVSGSSGQTGRVRWGGHVPQARSRMAAVAGIDRRIRPLPPIPWLPTDPVRQVTPFDEKDRPFPDETLTRGRNCVLRSSTWTECLNCCAINHDGTLWTDGECVRACGAFDWDPRLDPDRNPSPEDWKRAWCNPNDERFGCCNNCFTYATCRFATRPGVQPGEPPGVPPLNGTCSCAQLAAALAAEGITPLVPGQSCPANHYEIAMVKLPDSLNRCDFHFYRRDLDGTWSDKGGCGGVRRQLAPPESQHPADIRAGMPHSEWCGKYCVPFYVSYQ